MASNMKMMIVPCQIEFTMSNNLCIWFVNDMQLLSAEYIWIHLPFYWYVMQSNLSGNTLFEFIEWIPIHGLDILVACVYFEIQYILTGE